MPSLTADQARARLSAYSMEKQILALSISQQKKALARDHYRHRKLTEAQQRMLRIIKGTP